MDVPTANRRMHASLAILIALVVVAGAGQRVQADAAGCCGLRPQDQLWLVSDRSLGCDINAAADRLRYWRYECERGWTPASLAELSAAEDPAATTTIFVHGYQIPSCEAFTKGWSAYRALVRCADDRPVRFIVWSWPSQQTCGIFQDVKLKAARTNVTAGYLAWFIDRLNPETAVNLWGHSFGARAITGALHLLGGGSLGYVHLEERKNPSRAPAQVVLMAAALDSNWLYPGHFHGQALSQTSSLLLVNNGCDRLLMRYHLLYHRRDCREALGYVGLYRGRISGDDHAKVMQIDACCHVGKQHQFALYLSAPAIMNRTRGTLLSPASVPASDQPELVDAGLAQPGDAFSPAIPRAATVQ